MAFVVGIPRETFPGERRVGLIPRQCDALRKSQIECLVEHSAGLRLDSPTLHMKPAALGWLAEPMFLRRRTPSCKFAASEPIQRQVVLICR